MEMIDQEMRGTLRKLFHKFLLMHLLFFLAAGVLSSFFTAHFKQRLGEQIAAASRDALLSGDSRQVISSMPSSMARDFHGMSWRPDGHGDPFSVPPGAGDKGGLLEARTRIPLWFDETGAFPAGEMVFYYSRLTPLLLGALSWLALLLLTLPLALYERRRLIRDYALMLDLRIKESYSALAAQVAHDIRSPLAALGAAARNFDMTEGQRSLVEGALDRIQGIAGDLLRRYRDPEAVPPARAARLDALAEKAVSEKRLQYAGRPDVRIEFINEAPGLKGMAEPGEFQRLLSNLMNNAVEAMDGPGEVRVRLYLSGGRAAVEVKDNGRGMSPEALSKAGQKGATHGKSGGTGLGLYHARHTAESWGGSLEIISAPGKGTAVTVLLPVPADIPRAALTVLLDDDRLVHMSWRASARTAGAELRVYGDPEEFMASIDSLPKDASIYLDSELGGGKRGEDLALRLHELGFSDITMATGHEPGRFAGLPWLKVAGKEPPWA